MKKYKTVYNAKGEPEYYLIPVKEFHERFPQKGSKVVEPPAYKSKEEIIEDIREALEEVKLHQEGKIKLKTAREYLNEL